MNNFEYITTMKLHEMAEFLRTLLDPDVAPEIGCFHCINYGTHHSDPAYKGTNLYECEGCPDEGVGLDLGKWLMKERNDCPNCGAKMGEDATNTPARPENCRYYTENSFWGSGCLGTKEIDACQGENCGRWKPKMDGGAFDG